MGLETFGFINSLVRTNPVSADPKSQGDDHIRGVKGTLLDQFPNLSGAVTPTHTELNYVDGVTSSIQGQIDLKAPLASPDFTGLPTAPTADVGTTGEQIATLDFVIATAFSGALPGQVGNADKLLTTDGTNASWGDTINPAVVTLTGGIEIVGESGAQVLEDKSVADIILVDGSDNTKAMAWDLSDITTATTRTVTVVDENVKLFTGYLQYIGKVSASNSATVDIEGFFTSEWDDYVIECNDLIHAGVGDQLLAMRIKTTASYLTTGYSIQEADGAITTGTGQCNILTYDSGTNQTAAFSIWFARVNDSKAHGWNIRSLQSTNFLTSTVQRGAQSSANAITGVRFFLASANIATGDFRVYGIRKS